MSANNEEILNTADLEESLFSDVDQMSAAASKVVQKLQQQPPISIKSVAPVPAPPTAPIKTEEEKTMDEYNKEKQTLFGIYDQVVGLAYADQNGTIVRNFGISQLVLKIDDSLLRVNGLIVLRAMKVKCNQRMIAKNGNGKETKNDEAGYKEEIAGYLYEVWGQMENGSLGLTSSYIPGIVMSIIDLKSGYDVPPDGDD